MYLLVKMRSFLQRSKCDTAHMRGMQYITNCHQNWIDLRIWQQSDNEMHNVPPAHTPRGAVAGDTHNQVTADDKVSDLRRSSRNLLVNDTYVTLWHHFLSKHSPCLRGKLIYNFWSYLETYIQAEKWQSKEVIYFRER